MNFAYSQDVIADSSLANERIFFPESFVLDSLSNVSCYTAKVIYGHSLFSVTQSRYNTCIYTLNGELISTDFRGNQNTAFIGNQLVIVNLDTIVFYNTVSDSIYYIPFDGATLIGIVDNQAFISSGINVNLLYGKKIKSNSIIKYDGRKLSLVMDRDQGSIIKGQNHSKIFENECVYYSDDLKIFSSRYTKPKTPKLILVFDKQKVLLDLDTGVYSFSYPSVHLMNEDYYLYNHSNFFWYRLSENELQRINCRIVNSYSFMQGKTLFSISNGFNYNSPQIQSTLYYYLIENEKMTPIVTSVKYIE
jgi:hypothetical protein